MDYKEHGIQSCGEWVFSNMYRSLNGSGLVSRLIVLKSTFSKVISYLIYCSLGRHFAILLAPGVASLPLLNITTPKTHTKNIPPSSCPAAAATPGKAGLFLLSAQRHVNTTEIQQSKVHHLLLRVNIHKLQKRREYLAGCLSLFNKVKTNNESTKPCCPKVDRATEFNNIDANRPTAVEVSFKQMSSILGSLLSQQQSWHVWLEWTITLLRGWLGGNRDSVSCITTIPEM